MLQLLNHIIYHKFIRSKEATSKEAFLQEFRYYKNLINKLTRISKINFCWTFFEEHGHDSKRTWDGIRSIMNVKKANQIYKNK